MFHKLIYILLCVVAVSACKSPEARRPVQSASGTFIKQSVERNKKIYATEEARIKKIIAADSANDYIASDGGFWYYYNTKDTTASIQPTLGNYITFTYDIKDLNGNTIVSETENGLQQYRVDQTNQDLISGLRDGLKLMKQGETVTFIFPSYKAYGYYGLENKIGANVPVISKVTLKTIDQSQNN